VKAIIFNEYGGSDVLAFGDVPIPAVGPDIVLIRTHAAGVNPAEWKAREGALAAIFPTHFPVIPGWDVAGVVDAVGVGVHEYEVGDELLGYVRRDHCSMALMPSSSRRPFVRLPANHPHCPGRRRLHFRWSA
jgi:NADPH:quinone reductase-like Zn-dependent oxidoreductase